MNWHNSAKLHGVHGYSIRFTGDVSLDDEPNGGGGGIARPWPWHVRGGSRREHNQRRIRAGSVCHPRRQTKRNGVATGDTLQA